MGERIKKEKRCLNCKRLEPHRHGQCTSCGFVERAPRVPPKRMTDEECAREREEFARDREEWRIRIREQDAQRLREEKILNSLAAGAGLTGHFKSKVWCWSRKWDGLDDMGSPEFADRIVQHIRDMGRNPSERSKALLEEVGIGKPRLGKMRCWLEGRGEGDLLPKPSERPRPGPVPRCPHCNQRLPKDMR